MYISETLPKHEEQINSEAKKMGIITSPINCAVSVMVQYYHNETSFQSVNYINDISKVKNAVLRLGPKKTTFSPQFWWKINVKRSRLISFQNEKTEE